MAKRPRKASASASSRSKKGHTPSSIGLKPRKFISFGPGKRATKRKSK